MAMQYWKVPLILAITVVIAATPVLIAHEVMHGFGGAIFLKGAKLSLNGANPQGNPGLAGVLQWVSFALGGTVYLFYTSVVFLCAFRKWGKDYLLGIALATGTLHQVGFVNDMYTLLSSGFVEKKGSDPFHAGAILWNGGPIQDELLPWAEIVFTLSGSSAVVSISLIITLAIWVCLAWNITTTITGLIGWSTIRLMTVIVFVAGLYGILLVSVAVSYTYALFATFIFESTNNWELSLPWAVLVPFGIFLLALPLGFRIWQSPGAFMSDMNRTVRRWSNSA